MTIITLTLNATQLSKFKSTDTIGEICMNICGHVLKFLSTKVLVDNPAMAKRVEVINTMVQWYMGILSRACPEDSRYQGVPAITLIYLEKREVNQDFVSRFAFNLTTLDKAPVRMLLELMHKIVEDTIACISPRIISMTEQRIEHWAANVVELLEELDQIFEMKPRTRSSCLSSAMLKVRIPDGHNVIEDYV
jgi:hypothetical protein